MSTPHCPLRRISAKATTTHLAEFLSGKLGYHQLLRNAAPSSNTGMRSGVLPDGMVMGFIPNPEHPSDILLVPAPLRGTMIPTAALSIRAEVWHISPQIVRADRLAEFEAIEIEKSDWIMAISKILKDFSAQRYWRDVAADVWAIVSAWPKWEAARLSWKARAADLAKRLGAIPLSTNLIQQKCTRMGLRRK